MNINNENKQHEDIGYIFILSNDMFHEEWFIIGFSSIADYNLDSDYYDLNPVFNEIVSKGLKSKFDTDFYFNYIAKTQRLYNLKNKIDDYLKEYCHFHLFDDFYLYRAFNPDNKSWLISSFTEMIAEEDCTCIMDQYGVYPLGMDPKYEIMSAKVKQEAFPYEHRYCQDYEVSTEIEDKLWEIYRYFRYTKDTFSDGLCERYINVLLEIWIEVQEKYLSRIRRLN